MSCNLVGGMLQRIDGLRKVGFGSMIIFGEDNNSTISGVWVFRGQTLGFEVHYSIIVHVFIIGPMDNSYWTSRDNSLEQYRLVNSID